VIKTQQWHGGPSTPQNHYGPWNKTYFDPLRVLRIYEEIPHCVRIIFDSGDDVLVLDDICRLTKFMACYKRKHSVKRRTCPPSLDMGVQLVP